MTEAKRKWLSAFPNLSPKHVIRQFLPLLGAAWEAQKHLFNENDLEDSITKLLIAWMVKSIRGNPYIAWGIRSQPEILEIGKDGRPKVIGRCDLTIEVTTVQYIYECKRLWPEGKMGKFTDSARLYVTKGLHRFLYPSDKQHDTVPQYPSWLNFAGMLAYVMNGKTSAALTCVQKAICSHTLKPNIEPQTISNFPTDDAYQFLSAHLSCEKNTVHVHHVLLAVPSPQQ